MSLIEFQHVLSKLVLMPEFRELVRNNVDEALAPFDLTPLEQRRLTAAAHSRGIALGTMLHRARRLTTLATTLPRTCITLAQDFERLVEAYWQSHPPQNLYHEPEAIQFGAFVMSQLQQGVLQNEFIEEIVRMELAVLGLTTIPQNETPSYGGIGEATKTFPYLNPKYRLAFFHHDPETLLNALDQGHIPKQVQIGDYCLILSRSTSKQLQLQQIDTHLGQILAACNGQYSLASLCHQFALKIENFATLGANGYIYFRNTALTED